MHYIACSIQEMHKKGHTVDTSGKTLLQEHLSFYPHISANHAVQGKILSFFLLLLLFSVKNTSSRFAVTSVRLNRPQCLHTAAARRLDGLCSLQGYLRCLLERLCFVNFTPRCISWVSMSAVCQEFHSKTQTHKIITGPCKIQSLGILVRTFWNVTGLQTFWWGTCLSICLHICCFVTCHSGLWACFHLCWSDSTSDSGCTFECLNAPQ